MEDVEGLRYSFMVEWFDTDASLIRRFYLFYFPADDTIELYDLKNQRTFLRRVHVDGVNLRTLFVGAQLNVLGRLMTVKSFGDEFTKHRLGIVIQRTFAMVKPDCVHRLGEIINVIYENGFKITKLKMTEMSPDCASSFYKDHENKVFFHTLVQYMTGRVVAMELVGRDAIKRWRDLMGPTDSNVARETQPDSIRAQFGTNKTVNAVHGSDSEAAAERELGCFFPDSRAQGGGCCRSPPATATFCNTTCCIVKPHVVKDGCLGQVLLAIENGGFNISAAQMFNLDLVSAEEFYEVYKGVVPEYKEMVVQLTSGPCVALEVQSSGSGSGEGTVEAFRKLVGPPDPELARTLRPHTIRARFGVNRVLNAVHCTDLPDDAQLEVEYFFRLLQ